MKTLRIGYANVALAFGVSLSAFAEPLPVAAPTGTSSYFMEVFVRHPLVLPVVRHHDYRFTEVRPDGSQVVFESNFGIAPGAFQPTRPFRSFHSGVPGRMSDVAQSERNAARTPTMTRHYAVPLTEEAFRSAEGRIAQVNAGLVPYQATPGRDRSVANCITAGIPPIAGDFRAGVGMFAAPRILRKLESQGLTTGPSVRLR